MIQSKRNHSKHIHGFIQSTLLQKFNGRFHKERYISNAAIADLVLHAIQGRLP